MSAPASTALVAPLTPQQVAQIPSAALPITAQLAYLLDGFTTLSMALFNQLTTKGVEPEAEATQKIYQELMALDIQLAGVIQLAVQHQLRQDHIIKLTDSLERTNTCWRATTTTLQESLSILEPIVKSGALDRAQIKQAAAAALTPAALLAYARLLAPFTSAPPKGLFTQEQRDDVDPSGRGLPAGARPPFPTEAMMRSGRLQFGRVGEGALGNGGEVAEVGGKLVLPFERDLPLVETTTDKGCKCWHRQKGSVGGANARGWNRAAESSRPGGSTRPARRAGPTRRSWTV